MAPKLYGKFVETTKKNSSLSDMFEVTVAQHQATENTPPVARHYNKVVLTRTDTEEHLLSFMLPVIGDIDLDNWNFAQYLESVVFTFGQLSPKYHNIRRYETILFKENNSTKVAIEWVPSTGIQILTLYDLSDQGRTLRISLGRPSQYRRDYGFRVDGTVVSNETSKDGWVSIFLSDNVLRLTSYPGRSSEDGKQVYEIPLKKHLTSFEKSAIGLGVMKKPLTSESFESDYTPPEDILPLHWESFGKFEYLRSDDGKITIVFSDNDEMKAIAAVGSVIADVQDRVEQISDKITFFDHLTKIVGNTKSGKDCRLGIIRFCIDFVELGAEGLKLNESGIVPVTPEDVSFLDMPME
jgi:hypothetical protein